MSKIFLTTGDIIDFDGPMSIETNQNGVMLFSGIQKYLDNVYLQSTYMVPANLVKAFYQDEIKTPEKPEEKKESK